MDATLLEAQASAVLGRYAAAMGVESSAFATDRIVVVDRPAHAPFPYLVMALTNPRGTVVALDPAVRAVIEPALPGKHYRVTRAEYLSRLRDLCRAARPEARIDGPDLGWARALRPIVPALLPGLKFVVRDAAWMNDEQGNGRFENGVGVGGTNAREVRNRYAVAITDSEDAPVAVGGVFDSVGLSEIGVDVVPEWRGHGLGAAVVAAAAVEILARGGTPFYGCAADNTRSQRTALSVGFLPIFTDASIS